MRLAVVTTLTATDQRLDGFIGLIAMSLETKCCREATAVVHHAIARSERTTMACDYPNSRQTINRSGSTEDGNNEKARVLGQPIIYVITSGVCFTSSDRLGA